LLYDQKSVNKDLIDFFLKKKCEKTKKKKNKNNKHYKRETAKKKKSLKNAQLKINSFSKTNKLRGQLANKENQANFGLFTRFHET